MQWLEERYPNQLPMMKVSDFELGILIGQQQLIEQIKVKLQVEGDKIDEEVVK